MEQKTIPSPPVEKSMMTLNKGANLLERHWKAIEIMGKNVEEIEGMKQAPYLIFKNNGDITAHGGCNAIFGRYELGMKNFIVIDNLSQTEMACESTHFDAEFTEALTLGKQYNVIGEDRLHLMLGKRAPLAVFIATNPEVER